MNENPLERLNYYNGQRLEASDFKTEQDYHIRTRRWLNKSLYSAGIARGLEVRAVPGSPSVAVSPGLALDSEGREIILLEVTTVEVCSYAGSNASTVVGNYLVIEYAEETIAYQQGGCAVRTTGTSASKSTTNWGGPSRIQAQVKFSWVPFVPQPGSNQIVLAQVELNSTCSEVFQIDAGARHYIGAASAATVKQYALEGEREVAFIPQESFPTLPAPDPQPTDVEVVGHIYFHIRGRQPSAVTLYLRAEQFSPLHYTEMGLHQHALSVGANISTSPPIYDVAHPENYTHNHTLNSSSTKANIGNESSHKHTVLNVTFRGSHSKGDYDHVLTLTGRLPLEVPVYDDILPSLSMPGGRVIGYGGTFGTDAQYGLPFTADVEGATEHSHTLTGTTDDKETKIDHTHTLSPSVSMADAGVTDLARDGEPLEFVDNLQIFVGLAENMIDRTVNIRQQLADADPANWGDGAGNPKALGDGSGNHILAMSGTGPIRLDFLPGMTFAEGEYCIELKVDAKTEVGKRVANGGKMLYNLYIE